MYRALHGLSPLSSDLARAPTNENASGCLLADDMGLGEIPSVPRARLDDAAPRSSWLPHCEARSVGMPASLVGSWGAEVNKWLGGIRAQAALAEGGVREAAGSVRAVGARTSRTLRVRSTGGKFWWRRTRHCGDWRPLPPPLRLSSWCAMRRTGCETHSRVLRLSRRCAWSAHRSACCLQEPPSRTISTSTLP